MKITAIQMQRKRQDRLSIYIDGEFWSGITSSVLEKTGISVGQELSKDDVEKLKIAVSEGDALQKALDLLSRQGYSRGILREKLLSREYAESVVEHCLDRLEELYLLNDTLYAESVSRSCINAKRSKRWLLRKLQEKKIEIDLAEKVADEAYPQGKELELANILLDSRYKRPLSARELQKASSWLMSRGYSSDELRPLLMELRQEAQSEIDKGEEQYTEYDLDNWKRKINRKWPKWQSDFKEKQKVQGYLLRQGISFGQMKDLFDKLK